MRMMAALIVVLFLAPGSEAQSPRTHAVLPQDCLWNLADHYYHDPFQWTGIAAANAAVVKNPHWIYPGQVLLIPELAAQETSPEPEVSISSPPDEGATALTGFASAPEEAGEPSAPEGPESSSAPSPLTADTAGTAALPIDGLSKAPPPGLAGQFPSMKRLEIPPGWKPDGKVLEKEAGRVAETSQFQLIGPPGSLIEARLGSGEPLAAGDRFLIYRRASPFTGEKDSRAAYLLDVGSAELVGKLGSSRYILRVVHSDGAAEAGDLLVKERR